MVDWVVWVGQVEDRLNDLGLEDVVFLPQVQYPDDATLVLRSAPEQVGKGLREITLESGREQILVHTVLVARLAHYRVDYIQPGYFVLRLALQDELLHTLDDVLIQLDGPHRRLGDGGHLRFGNGRSAVIESGELIVEGNHGFHVQLLGSLTARTHNI